MLETISDERPSNSPLEVRSMSESSKQFAHMSKGQYIRATFSPISEPNQMSSPSGCARGASESSRKIEIRDRRYAFSLSYTELCSMIRVL